MNDEVQRQAFNVLIQSQIGTYTSLYAPSEAVIPISSILRSVNRNAEVKLTKYRVRQALKSLIAEGLIYYTSQGRPAVISYGEVPELEYEAMPPVNGYALTEKAYKTSEWIAAYADWEKSMEEWAIDGE